MSGKNLYLLLNAIQKNADTKRLIYEGLTYMQIIDLTNEAILKGLVNYNDDKITLSEEGIKSFEEIKLYYKKTNKNQWIEKETKSKIPKIDVNYVYLPDQGNLHLD